MSISVYSPFVVSLIALKIGALLEPTNEVSHAGLPSDTFDYHWDRVEERVDSGEITREQANQGWARIIGMKVGFWGSAFAVGILFPGVGTAAAVAMIAAGTAGGVKLGHELAKDKR